MTERTIKIAGQEVGVAYCFATELAFAKYVGTGIESFNEKNPEHVAYFILAAILAYYQGKGEESPITDNEIMYKATPTEIINAASTVFKLRQEWYTLPAGEPADKPDDDDGKKNS